MTKEPYHGVYMVTGYDEAVEVYHDQATFSNCNSAIGPFAKFPVPLEGDDITEIIETYRDDLPFGDQIPSFDPPKHTAHRGLLMRLITPKRLKENEESLRHAGRQADRPVPRPRRVPASSSVEYAGPYTLLVIADLLGVPEEDRAEYLEKLTHQSHIEMTHSPLEYLYAQFTGCSEDRRREPRDDVMTGLATATFPDGTLPPVEDVMKIASNLFAAGQETTARASRRRPCRPSASAPNCSSSYVTIAASSPRSSRRPCGSNLRSRARSACRGHRRRFGAPRSRRVARSWSCPPPPTATREFEGPDDLRLDRENARQHIAFGHGIHTCAGAPLARAESNVSLQRLLDRMQDIRISESHHGPADARHWEYTPTWMLRGLDRLYLEFTPVY